MYRSLNLSFSLPAWTGGSEAVRSGLGALVGVLLTGVISTWTLAASDAAPLLMAPLGASAVLLFAVPASPLAQPWPALGGSLISALIGVTAALFVPDPLLAAAIAVGAAIAVMSLLRCLHPPGGAVALTAVLIAAGPRDIDYSFAISPVLLNSALLVFAAVAYHRLAGRSYPHRAHQPLHAHPPKRQAVLTAEDFEEVLVDYGEALDISSADLEMLYIELAGRAELRRVGLASGPKRSSGELRAAKLSGTRYAEPDRSDSFSASRASVSDPQPQNPSDDA